jgi:RNA-directed DNA polymerase
VKRGNLPQGTPWRKGRAGDTEPSEGTTSGRPSPEDVSTRLRRIAELARTAPGMALTNLNHHIDEALLHEAYRRTRKAGAPGIDGQTAGEYATDLEANLRSLLDRLKTGSYRAPPVRGVDIPKGKGKTRPIGIPTFEDKVLQRAIAMVLEPIYEQDFRDCSFGFRPGRSPHHALATLWQQAMTMGGCWVLEVDITGFFDNLDHRIIREFLDLRVRDGVVRRVIHKWLKAGVMRDGAIQRRETGTPQGGVISPILANIYLHEVLDKWFEDVVKPRLRGRAELIRYADDFVLLFEHEADARGIREILPKRFGKYGLTLHPEKTKLIRFVRPRGGPRPPRPGSDHPGTFDLLGFTHYWGRSRKGRWVIQRKTMSSRLTRGLHAIRTWCRKHRHLPVREQHQRLNQKLDGHYRYYGLTGNFRSLAVMHHQVTRAWRYWLNKRSREHSMPWPRFNRLLQRYPLTRPWIPHSACRAANSCP